MSGIYVPFTPPGPHDAIVTSHKVFSVSVGIPEAKNGENNSVVIGILGPIWENGIQVVSESPSTKNPCH